MVELSTILTPLIHSSLIAGLHKGGAAAVSGPGGSIYMSGAAVFAAQMGVNFRQFSGTVPL